MASALPPAASSRPALRPSFSSRLSIAINTRGRPGNRDGGESHRNEAPEEQFEEIEAIRRYEDFTTIDWVQDAARAQLHRRIQQRKKNKGFFMKRGATHGWRRKIAELYDAGQAWIVVSLIGTCIGLDAAFLNISTEWLSDIKQGHCSTAFYLNKNFCCWGAEDGCEEWHTWSSFEPFNYFLYILFSVLFAYTSAILVKTFAPYAAGSGISEIKCIIAGFVMKDFLGAWTLLIKSIGLPLAIASGLSVGKEGPSVHYAVCMGNVISRFFGKYRRNAAKTREILSACAAAGVAVAFGSPIGGVLFSLEEMSPNFPIKTLWRSYFCALVATAVLAAMNPFRTGQLVMFQVSYDRDWHFFEVIFFIIIGIFGGIYGEFVIKWNLRAQTFRKKYLTRNAVSEATFLAGITAVICYWNMFLKIDMTESMEILFHECDPQNDYEGLCERQHRWRVVLSLALATIIRVFLVIISYGCKAPAGIFVPSMAIGALFGRAIGIIVQAIHEAAPASKFFAACQPDVPCITPGTYAFLGAAAALSGIMHITVSVVVIMFELTGATTYILPTMIVVGVTKVVNTKFGGKGGIADRMIWFSGFPFLDNKEEHSFGVPVSHVMITQLTVLPSTGLELHELEKILATTKFQGFPVVQDRQSSLLLGYIGRTELVYGIDRAKRERPDGQLPPHSRCYFTTADDNADSLLSGLSSTTSTTGMTIPTTGTILIDFARYIDQTPLTVHPRLPLETVLDIFKRIGPRVVLVEHRGKLQGCITVKDCLVYQAKVEKRENATSADAEESNAAMEEAQEKLWQWIVWVASWVRRNILRRKDVYLNIHSRSRREGGVRVEDGDDDDDVDEHVELRSH